MVCRTSLFLLSLVFTLVASQANLVIDLSSQLNIVDTNGNQNQDTTTASQKLPQIQGNKPVKGSRAPPQTQQVGTSNNTAESTPPSRQGNRGAAGPQSTAVANQADSSSNNTAQSRPPSRQGNKGAAGPPSTTVANQADSSSNNTAQPTPPSRQGNNNTNGSRPSSPVGQGNGSRNGSQLTASSREGNNGTRPTPFGNQTNSPGNSSLPARERASFRSTTTASPVNAEVNI